MLSLFFEFNLTIMIDKIETSNKALIVLITTKKKMEGEYNTNLKELQKWDTRIELANRYGKTELANEALNRRNFYATLVFDIQQNIERIEAQITSAKQKLSSVSCVSSASVELLKVLGDFNLEPKAEEKDDVQDIDFWESLPDSPCRYPEQELFLEQELGEAIQETQGNINQAEKQYKKIKSQGLEYEKKAESFHVQALEFMTRGETNAATIALSSEATTKNLLDSLSIQLDNQTSLINMLKKHLKVLKRLENPQDFDVEEDSIVDSELAILRKKLNEL